MSTIRKRVEYVNLYRWGHSFVAVETGQPSENVCLGVGDTVAEAVSNMDVTPCQSVGPDSGVRAALSYAHSAGVIDDVSALEPVHEDDLTERELGSDDGLDDTE